MLTRRLLPSGILTRNLRFFYAQPLGAYRRAGHTAELLHRDVRSSAFATMQAPSPSATASYSFLSQAQAQEIDEELMGPAHGFSIDQLMELAGLSVAEALAEQYPLAKHKRVLVVAGPGNNGGDGLVAARHLSHWGYAVQVLYPKPTDRPLFHGLVTQVKALGIPLTSWEQVKAGGPLASQYDVIVDAIFGFSFKGAPRPPFDEIIQALVPSSSPPPVLSVDIPSGWDVEAGDTSGAGLRPDTLVSLTAPKKGSAAFQGSAHYLGGRFVPPAIRDKYGLQLPTYPGTAQHVLLGAPTTAAQQAAAKEAEAKALGQKVSEMRINYTVGGLDESHLASYKDNPMGAWAEWFKLATEGKVCQEPNALSVASVDPVTGQPSVRVVLLKGFDDRGFVFYTNYNSRKGQELEAGGKAAFCVYWEALQRQVRVEGVVERVPEEESAEYFQSRPRGSQVGAWVSQQSQPLPSGRQVMDSRADELTAQYSDKSVPVPKPSYWGGYLIRPTALEFWQGRPSRLHDRIRFRRSSPTDTAWVMERLQP